MTGVLSNVDTPSVADGQPVRAGFGGVLRATQDEKVAAERVLLLFRQYPGSLGASLVAQSVAAFGLYGAVPDAPLLFWYFYLAIVSGLRYALCRTFLANAAANAKSPALWEGRFALGSAAAGLGYAALPLFFYPAQYGPQQLLIVFIAGMMLIGSALVLAASWLAYALFALPVMLSLVTVLLMQGGPVSPMLGLLTIILSVVASGVVSRYHRMIVDSMHTRFEKDELIRELEEAEHSMQRALTDQQLILDTATVGIAFLKKRVVIRCNARLERMLGYAPGELNGRSTRIWYASDEEWRAAAAVDYPKLRDGQVHEGDITFVRKDGSRTWMRYAGQAVDAVDPDAGVIWVYSDLGPIRRYEENAAAASQVADAANQRLHDAVESIADAFAMFDPADRLVLCNEKYVQTFAEGKSAADLIGKTFEQLVRGSIDRGEPVPPDFPGGDEAWVAERVRRHRSPDGGEFVYQISGGRWLQTRERRTADGCIVGVRVDVTELKKIEEQVRHLANHDALTGLPNRRLLEDRLERSLVFAQRNRHGVAVMLLDLDGFKRINDEFGHAAGDQVLKAVAERIRVGVRAADTVARLGGDEFVVVAPEMHDRQGIMQLAEKILKAVAEPLQVEGRTHHLRISIGISSFPADAADAGTLLRHADTAMYNAKDAGRSQYRFFDGAGR